MSNDERESLRRIAYGPDSTPHERAAAETSLHELHEHSLEAASEAQNAATREAQQREEAVRTIGEPAEHTNSVDHHAVDSDDEPVAPSVWHRSIRVGWLIPLVAGCFILGATVALSTTGSGDDKGNAPSGEGSTSVPQGTTTEHTFVPPMPGNGPGNLAAANDWFADSVTTDEDLANKAKEPLDHMGATQDDVRPVGDDALQQNLLIARHGTDGFCMISVGNGAGPSWFSSCVTTQEFQASGLSLSGPGFAAYWDGESISTTN